MIQKKNFSQELVCDTFRKEILGIEKIPLPATSDDAASDGDTKKKYVGIWYMILLEKEFCDQKLSPPASCDVAASNNDTKNKCHIGIGM